MLLRRIGLALLAAASLVLLVEGAASLGWRRSLRHGLLPRPPSREDRGPYSVHADPLVGYTLRPDAELEIARAPVASDALGLRAEPGALPGAPRIVLLGDSIAFGYGVAAEDILARRLEHWLAVARGAEAPRPSCRTVAIPGWNQRNSAHFLLDHWDELLPDLVLALPVGNDVEDTDGVDTQGWRRQAFDPAAHDPWLLARLPSAFGFVRRALSRAHDELDVAALTARVGPAVLSADLSPVSQRRFDANAAALAAVHGQLVRRGGRLAVVTWAEQPHAWHLVRRLAPDVDVLPLFDQLLPEMTLGWDPHPSERTLDAAARLLAGQILERGWVDRGTGLPLPPLDADLVARRGRTLSRAEVLELAQRARHDDRGRLAAAFDAASGQGLLQVVGPLDDEGIAGPRLLVVLALPEGVAPRELAVRLEPVPGRQDLLPLPVEVLVDGSPLGRLELAGPDPLEVSWPLSAEGADVVEVELRAGRWGAGALLRSHRPLRVELRP